MCEKIQDLQNISTEDMSYVFKLTTEVIKSVSFRSTNTKERTTEVFNNYKSVKHLSNNQMFDKCDFISN